MPKSLNLILPSLFVAILLAFPARLLADPDTAWHLEAGRYIFQHLTIPLYNIFSYTADDYQWMNISWGWDVLIAIADKLGLLVIMAATCIFFTFYFALKYSYRSPLPTLICFILGILFLLPYMTIRPHLATFLILPIFIHYSSRLKLLPMILLIILWANLHGGFLVGFTVIAALGLQSNFKKYLIAGIICVAASLINPLGVGIYAASLRTLFGPLPGIINEWETIHSISLEAILIAFTMPLLLYVRKENKAIFWLSIFWGLMGIISARYMPIYYLIAMPMLAQSFSRFKWNDKKFEKDFNKLDKKLVPVLLIIVLCLGSVNFFRIPPASTTAKDEIRYVMDNQPDLRFLNSYDLGGYIISESHGQIKTFIDGRAETAFPPEVVADYMKFHNNKDWEPVLAKYNIEGFILLNQQALVYKNFFAAHPEWKLAYKGKIASVYVKK